MSSLVSLRRANASDSELFYRVIFETMREHVIATWGSWNDGRVRAESAEEASSPNANVVLIRGERAGVMTIARHNDHIQLEQLYLLPQYQRIGVGTVLMQDLLAEAKALGCPVRLRVLRVNPAKQFYERLGFTTTLETPERVFMECQL